MFVTKQSKLTLQFNDQVDHLSFLIEKNNRKIPLFDDKHKPVIRVSTTYRPCTEFRYQQQGSRIAQQRRQEEAKSHLRLAYARFDRPPLDLLLKSVFQVFVNCYVT